MSPFWYILLSLKDDTKNFIVLDTVWGGNLGRQIAFQKTGNNYIISLLFNNCLQIGFVSVPKLAFKLLACSIVFPDSKINGAELHLGLVFYCAIRDEKPVPRMLKQGIFWGVWKQNCKGKVIRKKLCEWLLFSADTWENLYLFQVAFHSIYIIFWSTIMLFENDTFILW